MAFCGRSCPGAACFFRSGLSVMKLIIFGSGGRVGRVLCRAAAAAGHELIAPPRAECNLMAPEAVADFVLSHPADAVVNCAAIAGLEACAADASAAHCVNAVAPAYMALACRHSGARFVHFSTDYVLDGRRPGLKDERAKCRPINIYGLSKLEGEQQVMEAYAESLILRVSWVCGCPERPGFPEGIVARALRGESPAAIDDKFSLPTHAGDIARVALRLIPLRSIVGPLHVASCGAPLSWHACACLALQAAASAGHLPHPPAVQRQKLAHAHFFREPRPAHTAMDTSALRALGISMPTAAECISRAVRDYLAASL